LDVRFLSKFSVFVGSHIKFAQFAISIQIDAAHFLFQVLSMIGSRLSCPFYRLGELAEFGMLAIDPAFLKFRVNCWI
jgi:hypothetical protein